MIARGEQGRATIDALLVDRRLERVAPSRELADALLDQGHPCLETTTGNVGADPTESFQLAYDAARKALAAILANQGLRSRGDGAHAVVLTAALAEFDPPIGPDLRHFDWPRRTRNCAGHPMPDAPPITPVDANDALPLAKATSSSPTSSSPTSSTTTVPARPSNPEIRMSSTAELVILTCLRSQSRNVAPWRSDSLKLAPWNAAVWAYSSALSPLPLARDRYRTRAATVESNPDVPLPAMTFAQDAEAPGAFVHLYALGACAVGDTLGAGDVLHGAFAATWHSWDVSCADYASAPRSSRRAPAPPSARFGDLLPDELDHPAGIHGPADAEHSRVDKVLALGVPHPLPEPSNGGHPEVIGNESGHDTVPAPFLGWGAQLLHDGGNDQPEHDQPDQPLEPVLLLVALVVRPHLGLPGNGDASMIHPTDRPSQGPRETRPARAHASTSGLPVHPPRRRAERPGDVLAG